ASIFELAQVYGASAAVSEGALNVATLVKLSKVVMLIPLLMVLGATGGGQKVSATRRIAVPWFVVGFLAVLAFNSVVTVHPQVRQAILAGDQFLFLMVTVALGLTTPVLLQRDAGATLRLGVAGAFALVLSAAIAFALAGWTQPALPHPTDLPVMPAALAVGGRQFDSVGCGKCHVTALQGTHGPVLLYSDLLLHDMGPGLDDKIVQGEATGADWRTAPLVGLHLRTRYLHDGRAATLRDAVLAHGGEAERVRQRFFDLNEEDQRAVLAFVAGL
ncbi:MAG: putative sulfate exporter family transporter, partial [Betaproteobacteria bacterium]